MSEDYKLTRLTSEEIEQYSKLSRGDECLCFGRYHKGTDGYNKNTLTQMIWNLKKKPSSRASNPTAYTYKTQAIKKAAGMLRGAIRDDALENKITLVPIPSSKSSDHEDFDPRMRKICDIACEGLRSPDVRELLVQRQSSVASHECGPGQRPSMKSIKDNLDLIIPKGYVPRKLIIIVDDVLTTGRHYTACKEVLIEAFPDATICGVFLARVDHQLETEESFSFWD